MITIHLIGKAWYASNGLIFSDPQKLIDHVKKHDLIIKNKNCLIKKYTDQLKNI